MKIGDFEIKTFVEQNFKLDGGSMFGVVPKTMWQKFVTPDENNRIDYVTNLFLLKANGKNILFETGFGDTLSDREKKAYAISEENNMTNGLHSIGVTENDIDYVILTHLHTDHMAGGLKFEDSRYLPRFPNATYITSEEEYNVAMNPNERTAAVYIPERILALKDSGKLELIGRNEKLFEGIQTVHCGGHTEGIFALEIESENQKLYYYTDLFMSSYYMKTAYIPATDLYPLDSMAIKRKKLPELINEDIILAYCHDPNHQFVNIHEENNKIVINDVIH